MSIYQHTHSQLQHLQETPSVYRAETVLLQSFVMSCCAVALVFMKTVGRVTLAEVNHPAIAPDFGHNRSESDQWLRLITADNRQLIGKSRGRRQTAIENDETFGRTNRQPPERASNRQSDSSNNPLSINDLCRDESRLVGEIAPSRRPSKSGKPLFTTVSSESFRIFNVSKKSSIEINRNHYRANRNRPGNRTSPSLIYPNDISGRSSQGIHRTSI